MIAVMASNPGPGITLFCADRTEPGFLRQKWVEGKSKIRAYIRSK